MNQWNKIFPSVFEWESGEKNGLTPQELLGSNAKVKELEGCENAKLPEALSRIQVQIRRDGVIARIPIEEEERFYGLGLQLHSFLQNGKRKRLTTNADAVSDVGDSHAPVPFYISSKGYGILVDSAATVEFDFGCSRQLRKQKESTADKKVGENTDELYENVQRSSEVTIFIKGAEYMHLYAFAANSVRSVTEQYNLFCGGGCLPPLWGLGNLYRCYTASNQEMVEGLIEQFDREEMPFSMIGLEPGWHSHAYSCSFTWNHNNFPDPERLIRLAGEKGMKLNVWEQAYVHPTAPFYKEICPYSGDYEVWDGAVPDFAMKEAGDIYGSHQEKLILQGIDAVKLDECDGADYTGNWFFPDYAQFPSGFTGEEEKNLYGAMVIRVIQEQFKKHNKRTFSEVRANYSYGAPMPYVLYSDLYDHRKFVRALCNAGFTGLLWCPEVRQCESANELLRRIQVSVFSPMSQINAWMIPNAPWKQYEIEKNKAGELLADDRLQKEVRELLQLRNRLVPYLYTAFYLYEKKGTPPFRPLVMDFPDEKAVWNADDCYIMGDSLLVAPILAERDADGQEKKSRSVYLPEGVWYDFWNDTRYEGGQEYEICTDKIPVFVKENHIVPLAKETESPDADSIFHLEAKVYGEHPEPFLLAEDDGSSFNYENGEQTELWLSYENGRLCLSEASERYKIG